MAGVAATAETDLDVQRNGASVGAIRFAASAPTAIFIAASEIVLEPGDLLEVIAPASPDATFADIAVTLAGTLVL
jgi:protein involved in polysaccharide export with SLBB domain